MASETKLGRLNAFQRSMLLWNDLHPYHAVHVMRLPGVLDFDRLQAAVEALLSARRISSIRLDRESGSYAYDGPPIQAEISTVNTDGRADLVLHTEIEQQLNRRFDARHRFNPFRFFVLADANSAWIGIAYFHPVADAESVGLLMRDLAAIYQGSSPEPGARPMDCHPPCPDRWMIRRPGLMWEKLLALPSEIRAMRHSYRAPLQNAEDLSNRFRLSSFDRETLDGVAAASKAWGVTIHDLLLALLMKALARTAPERHRKRRRNYISLGTIVNIRADHGIDSERTFGLFLGSFVVTHPVPDNISLQQLTQQVHQQTHHIKQRKLYLTTSMELAFSNRLLALYSPPRQKKFYHRYHPLWGGITNMNLNKLWPRTMPGRPTDYFRAVSTGPLTPLVLSASTFGDSLRIGLTYRPAVFSNQAIEVLEAEWRSGLTQLSS